MTHKSQPNQVPVLKEAGTQSAYVSAREAISVVAFGHQEVLDQLTLAELHNHDAAIREACAKLTRAAAAGALTALGRRGYWRARKYTSVDHQPIPLAVFANEHRVIDRDGWLTLNYAPGEEWERWQKWTEADQPDWGDIVFDRAELCRFLNPEAGEVAAAAASELAAGDIRAGGEAGATTDRNDGVRTRRAGHGKRLTDALVEMAQEGTDLDAIDRNTLQTLAMEKAGIKSNKSGSSSRTFYRALDAARKASNPMAKARAPEPSGLPKVPTAANCCQ